MAVGLAAIFCCLGAIYLLLFPHRLLQSQVHSPEPKTAPLARAVLTLAPTATPTPTLVPSPTITPTPVYTGYCLHVPVLLYHHIQPQAVAAQKGQALLSVDNEIFDRQMGYLAGHGYTVISGKQLIDGLRTKSGVPAKSVVVTLDDGYKDAYDYAFPIFKKYHFVGTFFIATGLLGGADYMSWGQVEEIVHSGAGFMADHTWSHYSLGRGNDDKIRFEVETAKRQLQDHTGTPIDVFAYPYGSYSARAISILVQEGFRGAYSTDPGTNQCNSFIMTLHRTRIGNASLSYYGF